VGRDRVEDWDLSQSSIGLCDETSCSALRREVGVTPEMPKTWLLGDQFTVVDIAARSAS
jgi:hypothetical protein